MKHILSIYRERECVCVYMYIYICIWSIYIGKLWLEAQKLEVWLAEVERKLPAPREQAWQQSGMHINRSSK